MMPPPPNGTPYDLVPSGQSNPDAYGAFIAWSAYQFFAGTVLGQAQVDLANVNGVPM